MGRFFSLCAAIGILALTTPNAASNGDVSNCSVMCGPNDKSHFKTDHSYKYSYSTVSAIDFSVSKNKNESQKSGFHLTAEVELDVLSACELILRIDNVVLTELNSAVNERNYDYFAANVTKFNLKVHTKNNKVEEICPSVEEQPGVLNIKKGILSALQYTFEEGKAKYDAFETDVHGVCKSEYTSGLEDGKKVVTRNRLLNDCIHKDGPFYVPNESFPEYNDYGPLDKFLNTQKCTYVLGDTSEPSSVKCHEEFNLNPKSFYKISGEVKIMQTLQLNSVIATTQDLQTNTDTIKDTVIMDMSVEGKSFKNLNFSQVLEVLATLKGDKKKIIDEHNFVTLVRNSKYQELVDGFRKIKVLSVFFLNSLLSAHTADSVKALNDIQEKELNYIFHDSETTQLGVQRNALLLNPTKDLLKSLQPNLRVQGKHSIGNFLTLSSIINTFCEMNPKCQDEPEIEYFMNYWDSIIQTYNHQNTSFNDDDLIRSLLAIGNVGWTKSISAIKDIIKDSTLQNNVRIAAMQSVRKMICESFVDDIESVFKNTADNNVIRITAFMNSLRCPSQNFFDQIINSLQDEEFNEVTIYIWTYLNKASNLPKSWSKNISNVLMDKNLVSKYQPKTDDYNIAYFENYEEFPTTNNFIKMAAKTSYKNKIPSFVTMFITFGTIDNYSDQYTAFASFRNMDKFIKSFMDDNRNLLKNNNEAEDKTRIDNDYTNMSKKVDVSNSTKYENFLFYRNFNCDVLVETNELWFNDIAKMLLIKLNRRKSLKNSMKIVEMEENYRFPTMIGFPLKFNIPLSIHLAYDISHNLDTNAKLRELTIDFDVKSKLSSTSSVDVTLNAYDARASTIVHMNSWIELNFNGSLGVENGEWKQFEFNNMSPKKMFFHDIKVENDYKTRL